MKMPLFLPSMLRLWVVLRTEVLVFRAQVYWPPSLLLIGQHWLSVHQSQLKWPLWTNQRPALWLYQPIPAHLSPRTVRVTPWPPGAEATPSRESCSTLKVSAEITWPITDQYSVSTNQRLVLPIVSPDHPWTRSQRSRLKQKTENLGTTSLLNFGPLFAIFWLHTRKKFNPFLAIESLWPRWMKTLIILSVPSSVVSIYVIMLL